MTRRRPFFRQRTFHLDFVEKETRRGVRIVRWMRNPTRPGEGIQVLEHLLALDLESSDLGIVACCHRFLDFALHHEPTQVDGRPFGIVDAQVVDSVPSRHQRLLLVGLPGPQEQHLLRHTWFLQSSLYGDVMFALQRRTGGVGETHHHRRAPRTGRGPGMNANSIVAVLRDQLRQVRARPMRHHRPCLIFIGFATMAAPHFDAGRVLVVECRAEGNLMVDGLRHFRGRAFVSVQLLLRLIDIGLRPRWRVLHGFACNLCGPFEIARHLRLIEEQRAADPVEAIRFAIGR